MPEPFTWPGPSTDTPVTSIRKVGLAWRSDPTFVYIGLPGYAGEVEGYFGKPWSCLRHPEGWQAGYREYLRYRISDDPCFAGAVASLHGHTLVCFCKGKRGDDAQPCHGDLLALAADYLHSLVAGA